MEIEGMEGLQGTDLIQDTFLFKRERRRPGEIIIEEGELGQALYIIEQGSVEVLKGEEGARNRIAVLSRGELFGEMSLIEDELTSATVAAGSEVELLVIRKSDFLGLLEQNPEIALKVYQTFCHILSERLRKTSGELSELKTGLRKRESRPAASGSASRKPKSGKGAGGKKSGARPGRKR